MQLVGAFMLATVGLVLLRAAFGPDPDPRNVLRELLSGGFSLGGASASGPPRQNITSADRA